MHCLSDIQQILLLTCYVPVLCQVTNSMLLAFKLLRAYACKKKQSGSSLQDRHLKELQKVCGRLISRKPSCFGGVRVQENLVDSITQAVLVSKLQKWARPYYSALIFVPYHKWVSKSTQVYNQTLRWC